MNDISRPAQSVTLTGDGKTLVVPTEDYNISNLIIGKSYTYKQLTQLLNIKYTSGGGKVKQLNQLSRYVNYKKEKNKYIIIDIYDQPLPQEITFPSYSKYVSEMVDMMLVYFFNQYQESIFIDFGQLYNMCWLVNKDYLFYGDKKSLLAKEEDISVENVEKFYFEASSFTRHLIKSALDAMESRRIIHYYSTYKVVYKSNDDFCYREASDSEITELLIIENNLLKQCGFKDIREVNATLENRNKYYTLLHQKIIEKYPYFESVYKTYKVFAPVEIVIDELRTSRSRQQLNEKVFSYLKEHADRTYSKYQGQYNYDEKWRQAQHLLAERLVIL